MEFALARAIDLIGDAAQGIAVGTRPSRRKEQYRAVGQIVLPIALGMELLLFADGFEEVALSVIEQFLMREQLAHVAAV